MTIQRVRQLAAGDAGLAIVSIARSDGTAHTSLVNAGVTTHPIDGREVVGLVVRGSSHKLRLLAANPNATVTWRVGWEWIAVDGRTEACGPHHPMSGVDADAIPELLRQVFRDAGGSHDDWDEYDRVMAEERRTAVFVEPSRFLGNR
ncbi:MAG: pyridoxamine 5'-phosphate oxidase [Acidimicrobiales bacterium]